MRILLVALLLCCSGPVFADETPATPPDLKALQGRTDRLRQRLEIPEPVVVSLVAKNPLVASVQPSKEKKGTFLLSLERGFLVGLRADELDAVLAHELGHVWIYTHHPYLQTEQLANRIAVRVVTHQTLAQVYGKVWGATSMPQSLASFLGLPATTPATAVGIGSPATGSGSTPR